MSEPLVSIVIPAYNAGATLGESIASALVQQGVAAEIIVVDDGSTDDTARVAEGYGSRVRLLRQENGGLSAARNTGHAAARGRFIAWLDADDVALPDRMLIQASYLDAHPGVGLVSSNFSTFNAEGAGPDRYAATYYAMLGSTPIGEIYSRQEYFTPPPDGSLQGATPLPVHRGRVYEHLVWGNFVHPPTVMLRREVVEAAGPLDPAMRLAEDWEFLIRASRVTEFAFLDVPLLRYRLHPGQMSATPQYKQMVQWIAVREKTFAADPTLAASRRERSRRQLGSWHSWLARHAADSRQRALALHHLARAAWLGLESRVAMSALALAIMPRGAIHFARLLRHLFRV